MRLVPFVFLSFAVGNLSAQAPQTPALPARLTGDLDTWITRVNAKMVTWRGDLHAHTTILMGVAEVLAEMKALLPGSITLLLQVADEAPPNGGAKAMVAAGALDNPRVEAVYGPHAWPGPTGTISPAAAA